MVIILFNMNQNNQINELGQLIGEPIENWKICAAPLNILLRDPGDFYFSIIARSLAQVHAKQDPEP